MGTFSAGNIYCSRNSHLSCKYPSMPDPAPPLQLLQKSPSRKPSAQLPARRTPYPAQALFLSGRDTLPTPGHKTEQSFPSEKKEVGTSYKRGCPPQNTHTRHKKPGVLMRGRHSKLKSQTNPKGRGIALREGSLGAISRGHEFYRKSDRFRVDVLAVSVD